MRVISLSTQRVIEAARSAPMLDQVERWAALNTGTRNLAGLNEMAMMLVDAFSVLPGSLSLVDPAAVDAVAPNGQILPVVHGQHLHLTVRPHAPVQVLLTGHIDTVYEPSDSFQKVRWLKPGVLHGPGVADMKGGLAVMLAALAALEQSDVAGGIGYEVVINSDEEVGSPSSAALIARAAKGKLAAFTYEPALPDGTLAGARAGSGNFSIVVLGRSAHAGRNPEDGRNAVIAAADIALRLKQASSVRPDGRGVSCNPAKIEGGGPNNIVPDHAVLRVNFRPRTPADELAASSFLDQIIADVAAEHQVLIHRHGGFGRPPKLMDDKAEGLFALVKRCGLELGIPISWRDTGGVCDGNNIAACGVPVVDTMGVRGGSIHSADEYLLTDSLGERASLSALTLIRIAEKGLFAVRSY